MVSAAVCWMSASGNVGLMRLANGPANCMSRALTYSCEQRRGWGSEPSCEGLSTAVVAVGELNDTQREAGLDYIRHRGNLELRTSTGRGGTACSSGGNRTPLCSSIPPRAPLNPAHPRRSDRLLLAYRQRITVPARRLSEA